MKKQGKRYGLFVLFFCVLFGNTGCKKEQEVYFERKEQKEEQADTAANQDADAGADEAADRTGQVFVYVCGAVKNPGVYELKAKQRICDAIEAAGGLCEEAAEESLNQAEELTDGQMIRVMTIEEAEEAALQGAESEVQNPADSADGRVNINTADANALMQLPGIGQSKADSIISYREEHGGFKAAEELMKISGIKEGVYQKIKDSITVN